MKLCLLLLTGWPIAICPFVQGGEIQDLYQKLVKDGQTRPATQWSESEHNPQAHEVSEVGLECTGVLRHLPGLYPRHQERRLIPVSR